jgi:hypothetical protein
MSAQETTNIKRVSSWDSGGGITIDVVELQDGRVLGITEESVVLYESMDDLMQGSATIKRPCIHL